jgi:hypothetical protein
MKKWNYPPEYLKKDGKLKKNCLKKAAEWRKNYPPKFLAETTFNEQMTSRNKHLDDLLELIPYPSYQHMNQDIIDLLAEILIGDISNNGMNSIEECEMFRGFCIMNKRLCLLDEKFRKKYNIKEKIHKCKLIYETDKIFKKSKRTTSKKIQSAFYYNKSIFEFITSTTFISSVNDENLVIETSPLIATINCLNNYILNKQNIKIVIHNEYIGYNVLFTHKESYYTFNVYSFSDLIKLFKRLPLIYDYFMISLRKNYCKNSNYQENKNIELNIRYFMYALMY